MTDNNINIDTVSAGFIPKGGGPEDLVLHSFSDFLEIGNPMEDGEEMDLAHKEIFIVTSMIPGLKMSDVYVRIVDGSGNKHMVSMEEIYLGGCPVDLSTDKEMDLDSEEVFVFLPLDFLHEDDLGKICYPEELNREQKE